MLRFISYLAPSIPEALFRFVAQRLGASIEFETRISDALKSRIAEALLAIEDLTPFGFARFAPVAADDYDG